MEDKNFNRVEFAEVLGGSVWLPQKMEMIREEQSLVEGSDKRIIERNGFSVFRGVT